MKSLWSLYMSQSIVLLSNLVDLNPFKPGLNVFIVVLNDQVFFGQIKPSYYL